MLKNLRKEEAVLLCLSYWITIISVRSFLFVASIIKDNDPRITIEYMRIHHYLLGIFLLFIVGISFALKFRKSFFQLMGMGVGTALVIDEFSFLWTFSARDYWNLTQGDYWGITNFLAIVVMGIFFLIVAHLAPNELKAKKRIIQSVTRKVSSYRSMLFPVVFIVAFLFVLFYNANPEISHAKEIQPIVKHLKSSGNFLYSK